MFLRYIRTSLIALAVFTALCGVIYPLAVTVVAQLLFPEKANGSLLYRNGKPVGSDLIGQQFTAARYFWGRPSATSPFAYNASSSAGSNYGPLNPALIDSVKTRVERLKDLDPSNLAGIPVDLVTASGSGLDPDISVAGALYQVPRVARARGMTQEEVRKLVGSLTEGRQLGFLGEARVNVLRLNLTLDDLSRSREGKQ